MHREVSYADDLFEKPRVAGLYALTSVLTILLLADVWVPFSAWLTSLLGYPIPSWSTREFQGFRFALIAAILGGARVLFASLEKLTEGKIGADLATAIACIAAIAINEPLVAAEVVVIGLVGECLEAWAFGRVRRGVEKLTEVFPIRCWRLQNGQEERVLTVDLKVGDRVVVKPGAKIPVDGVVIDGHSSIDLSALTGESLPQDRSIGDAVLAGGINQQGALTVEARKVASATVVGQVIEATAKALKNKSQVERQVDRLAKWFLPVVLALAGIVFVLNLFWLMGSWRGEASRLGFGLAARQSLYPTLAVLVVTCPCALLLATPAAMVAAIGRLAGTGIVVKGGAVVEKLAGIEAIAFDKTGTLTEARLEIAAVDGFNGFDVLQVLRLAAGAERFSEHPLARCVLNEATQRGLEIPAASDFKAFPGAGAKASVENQAIAVGNRKFIEESGLSLTPEVLAALEACDASGATPILVAVGDQVAGILTARDRIRLDAADVLAELRNSGIANMALLTGDSAGPAGFVGEQLKIDQVFAGMRPTQKADWLKQHPGYAFIGDGINDAPALAQAPVGLAIRSPSSDAPSEVGDVVLLGEPLGHLPLLFRLARETVKVIRQNILIFAFGVNIVGVILVGVLWPLLFSSGELFDKSPLVGVLYHQVGSLAVLLNSLRLLFFERKSTAAAWMGFQFGLKEIDNWIERNFDLDHLLHEIAHRWKPVAATLGTLSVLLWLASGLTRVNADEVGVQKRFGRVIAELPPGLHVRFPWPIEETIKLKPAAVRTVEVGFRTIEDKTPPRTVQPKMTRPDPKLTWLSAHAENVFRISDESLMLTGDGNLVDVLANVQYSIADPTQYLTNCGDVDTLIRLTLESLLRERFSGEAFLDLLTIRRNQLSNELLTKLKRRLEQIHPEGLGIELLGLTMEDLHPPPEVVPSYHEVARAIQGRDQQINLAEAHAMRARRRAEEDAHYLLRIAEAAANERVRQAEAARDVFLGWAKYRTEVTDAEEAELRLLYPATFDRDKARLELLRTKRQLTEFRLAWAAVTAFLKGRDKVLIEADKLPGKRNLFLIDPEILKLQMEAKPGN